MRRPWIRAQPVELMQASPGRAGVRPGALLQLLVLILLALAVLVPLLWLVSTSLKGPAEDIFTSPPALLPAPAKF